MSHISLSLGMWLTGEGINFLSIRKIAPILNPFLFFSWTRYRRRRGTLFYNMKAVKYYCPNCLKLILKAYKPLVSNGFF